MDELTALAQQIAAHWVALPESEREQLLAIDEPQPGLYELLDRLSSATNREV